MIIEVDKYKEKIPGYDPAKSENFHVESAKLADKDFEKYLKDTRFDTVVFLAGGAASGKSEFVSLYLQDDNLLVYDGTLKRTAGFEIKYKKIQKYTHIKHVKVVLIIPANWEDSLAAFLGRDRKMYINTFIETQMKSKKSVLYLIQNYPNLKFEMYMSVFEAGTIQYDIVADSSEGVSAGERAIDSSFAQIEEELETSNSLRERIKVEFDRNIC